MAIKMRTRVRTPFSFAQLRERAESTLHHLLGTVAHDVAVVALDREAVHQFHSLVIDAPLAPRILDVMISAEGPDLDCYLAIPPLDAGVWVSIFLHDHDEEEVDDSGTQCWVDAGVYRTPEGFALSIATIIAAAELAGSPIVDEGIYFKQGYIVDPQPLQESLRLPLGERTLEEAIAELLGKTTFNYIYEARRQMARERKGE